MVKDKNVRGAPETDNDLPQPIEVKLSRLLQIGVLISSGTIFLGGVMNLLRHGRETVMWERFNGEPAALRSLSGIAEAAMAAQGKGVIQLGVILLIAVPVLRVAVSAIVFLWERDFMFAGLTLLVLVILGYSLWFAS